MQISRQSAAIIILILLLAGCQTRTVANTGTGIVGEAPDSTGFARVEGPQTLTFPDDHGDHPDYQTEWWYYTGNLENTQGRHFGFQLTFFRRALVPAAARVERESAWATDQVYLAHFTLTDVEDRGFHVFEQFARGAVGLAGVKNEPYRVWLGDLRVEAESDDRYRLIASQKDITIDLLMRDEKGPILQGDRGYSQKGNEAGNASIYYSLTRLQSEGTITIGEQDYDVTGLSWMDHEYSTSALSPGQVGWDWFALQLDDGTDLMLYHIRRDDGSIDLYSKGSFIDSDGNLTTLRYVEGDYFIDVTDTWRSPHSGGTYPAGWTITLPNQGLELTITPYIADQELNVSTIYWEGAVSITGSHKGRPITGSGYVEMTGYAASIEGRF